MIVSFTIQLIFDTKPPVKMGKIGLKSTLFFFVIVSINNIVNKILSYFLNAKSTINIELKKKIVGRLRNRFLFWEGLRLKVKGTKYKVRSTKYKVKSTK